MPIKITLLGRIPSKKNSQAIFVVGRKRIISPNQVYRMWEESKVYSIMNQLQLAGVKTPITGIRRVEIVLWLPDKRRTDAISKAEGILDALVKAKAITDDNWKILPEVRQRVAGVDRKNPRAEISIFLT